MNFMSMSSFSLKWNLLHGQAVSSSTAPFLSLVAESTRLFMLQSIGGIGKSATFYYLAFLHDFVYYFTLCSFTLL